MLLHFDLSRTETFLPAAWMLGKGAACACVLALWHAHEWAPAAQHALAALLLLAAVAEDDADRAVAARRAAMRAGGATRVAGDVVLALLALALRAAPREPAGWGCAWAAAWALAGAAAAACEAAAPRLRVSRECWGGVLLLAVLAATSPCAAHAARSGGPLLLGARLALYLALICARYYAAGRSAAPNLAVHGWVLVAQAPAALAAAGAALVVGAWACCARAASLPSPRAPCEAEPAPAPAAAAAALHCLEEDFVRQMHAMEADHAPPERERRRHGMFAA